MNNLETESQENNGFFKIIVILVIFGLLFSIYIFRKKNKGVEDEKTKVEISDQENLENSTTSIDKLMKDRAQELREKLQKELPELQKKALENPEDANLQQNLAIAQYATGDKKKAEESYKKSISLNEKNHVAHNNLGNVYRDLGKYQDAEREYLEAKKQNSKYAVAYLNLGGLYEYYLKDNQKAIDIYLEGIKENPAYFDFYNILANLYNKIGDKEKAKEYYEMSLEINNDNPAAKRGLEQLK